MLRRNNRLSACTGEHAAELSVVQIQPGDIPEHINNKLPFLIKIAIECFIGCNVFLQEKIVLDSEFKCI